MKYDLPYPKWENDSLNYYLTVSDYDKNKFNIKENNLYNALSEVINYSLYFSFNINGKHHHEHDFDSVIRNVYHYPKGFSLNKEDEKCYSKDELKYIMHLQKFLLFAGRKDEPKITKKLCNNKKVEHFKNTQKIYFDDDKCKLLLNGKIIYLNLYSKKDNIELILMSNNGDILGILNADIVKTINKNDLKENDIDYKFLGYDNFDLYYEEIKNVKFTNDINIYKVSLKEKF